MKINLTQIELENIRNIKSTKIDIKSNIIGIYGENGSGKTSLIDSFKLLVDDYSKHESIEVLDYKNKNSDYYSYTFTFEVDNYVIKFSRKIKFKLEEEEYKYIGYDEIISYREFSSKGRSSVFYKKNNDENLASNFKYKLDSENISMDLRNISQEDLKEFASRKSNLAFVLNNKQTESIADDNIFKYVSSILKYINDIFIIDVNDQSLSNLNICIPFSFHSNIKKRSIHGKIPLGIDEKYYSEIQVEIIKDIINTVNKFLPIIADNRELQLEILNSKIDKDNEKVSQIVIWVLKDDVKIPLRYESTGLIKLITIFSTINYLLEQDNSLVVIDELDAHVYEYLLSVIVSALENNAKGNLIFTSHNLTLFEQLDKNNILISYFDEQKSANFKYLNKPSKTSNLRDIYIHMQNFSNSDTKGKSSIDKYEITELFEDLRYGL